MSFSDAVPISSHSSTFTTFDDACYSGSPIPKDWTLCVHPQGWIYFYNTTLKSVADQDLRDPDTLELVEKNILDYPVAQLEEAMEVQIHVQAHKGLQGTALFNLSINHRYCVASYNLEEVMHDNFPFLNPQRLNRCRRLYWNYLWNHPSHVPTPPRTLRDASDALIWFHTDNMISGSKSIIPFSRAECEELSRILRDLALPYNDNSIAKTVFLSWFLREVCSFRDSDSYGQHTWKQSNARRQNIILSTRLPSHEPKPSALMLINLIINCFFFGIPHTYWAHIKATSEYRGRLANVQEKWENYVDRLVREYSHFLLISTVLLSATVGFLSVQDVSEGARLAASVSALTSLSSIIIGVFSIWRHQANTSMRHSYTYMHNIQHSILGIPGHAILLSLPASLLVWAIMAFTVAIVAYALQSLTSHNIWGRVSAWTLLAVFVVLLVIVFLALYTFSIIWSFQSRTGGIWPRIRSGTRLSPWERSLSGSKSGPMA